jgi:3-methyl-2-oxobutanoate hydroxymethyltransferase
VQNAKNQTNDLKRSKFTVPKLAERKSAGLRMSMVTAYDSTFACIVDEAGVDLILVGDSVGTVMQGHKTTLSVSMEHMEYHVAMVASVKPLALVVGDLPFGSYQASHTQAIDNSVRLIKAGAEIVKLEGGVHLASTVAAITHVDIPVMAHIGLTPQSYHRMGGNKIQGRSSSGAGSRNQILEDALAVQEAGAHAVVIEGVPSDVAQEVTESLSIPTIGIGAGVHCDGQVLVMHDLLGLSARSFTFAKAYANLRTTSIEAVRDYVSEVHSGAWPDSDHSFQ